MHNRVSPPSRKLSLAVVLVALSLLVSYEQKSLGQSVPAKPAGPVSWLPQPTVPNQQQQPGTSTTTTTTTTSTSAANGQTGTTGQSTSAAGQPTTPSASAPSSSGQAQPTTSAQQQVPPQYLPPPNPLIMINPAAGGQNPTAWYDPFGNLQVGSTTPQGFVPNYTEQPFPQPEIQQPLEYFGYSYFRPAQLLIEARRVALLQRSGIPQIGSAGQPNPSFQYGQPSPYAPMQQPFQPPTAPGQQPPPGAPTSPATPFPGQQPYPSSTPYNNQYPPSPGTAPTGLPYGAPTQPNGAPPVGTNPYSTQPGGYNPAGAYPSYPAQTGYGASGYYPYQSQPYYGVYPGSSYGYPSQSYPYQPGPYGTGMSGYGAQPYYQGYPYTSQPQSGAYGPSTPGASTPYGNGSSGYGSGYGTSPTYGPNAGYGQSGTTIGIPGVGQAGGLTTPGQVGTPPEFVPFGQTNQLQAFGQGFSVNGQQTGQNGLSPLGQQSQLGGFGATSPGGIGLPGFGASPGSGLSAMAPGMSPGSVPGMGQPGVSSFNPYAGIGPSTMSSSSSYQPEVNVFNDMAMGPMELMSSMPSGGAVPQNYQLAGGDVMDIRISSPTMPEQVQTMPVDDTGRLTLPGIGSAVVRGMTLDEAEKTLQARIGRFYKGAEVTLTLREQRTMLVTIDGQAYMPGSYLVPASTSAYNVLYAAGGPTLMGSLRSVEVRRHGTLVGTLDLYDFLTVGGKSQDIPLQPGDVINIPDRYTTVAVTGEVRHAAIYELKPGETVKDAIHFAGGVKASGVTQRVQVNTEDPGRARVLKDIDLTNENQVASAKLYDGDQVDVFSVRDDVANRVTINGAVDQPGDYALSPGMKISDLVSRARGTRYNAYTAHADLYRWNADNTLALIPVNLEQAMTGDPGSDLALKRWDTLRIYGRDELTWTASRQVRVQGAVQKEGIYYRSDNMRVSDLLRMAGGPLPDAYLPRLVVMHQRPDGTFKYIYADAEPGPSGDPIDDPMIEDNDVLAVYRTSEAEYTANHIVTIDGEVLAPGSYPRGDGMHLSDLLKLSGGFTMKAGGKVIVAHANSIALNSKSQVPTSVVTFDSNRQIVSGGDLLLADGDVATVPGVGGFQDHVMVVNVDGQVMHPGPVALQPDMRLSDLIKTAGGLMPDSFPEGAEFYRDPTTLGSDAQRNIEQVVNTLTDLLNANEYERLLAQSDVDRLQAISIATGSASSSIDIPGLTSGSTSGAVSPSVSNSPLAGSHDLATQARSMNSQNMAPFGNVAVDVQAAMRHPGGSHDIMLQDGDTITIPKRPTTVLVAGAVYDPRAVVFQPDASPLYYVAQAGGFAPDAAADQIEIIRAGGGLEPVSRVHHLEAGDMILVPTKPEAIKISAHRNELDDALKTVAALGIIARLIL